VQEDKRKKRLRELDAGVTGPGAVDSVSPQTLGKLKGHSPT